MITIETLQKFCSRDAYYSKFQSPFSHGNYTYASNSHVMIRVARMIEVPEVEAAPSEEVIQAILDKAGKGLAFAALPELPAESEVKDCDICLGTGFISECRCGDDVNCIHCKGEGYFSVAALNGELCPRCKGVGRDFPLQYFDLGDCKVYLPYLHLINSLPNLTISLSAKPRKASRFKFEDGEGLIMPVQKSPFTDKNTVNSQEVTV